MDGGNVTEEYGSSTEEKTFTAIFEENCSYYMSIGMSYEEYWYGQADLPKYYRDAHTMRNKAENQKLWLQGLYFIRSIQVALDSKGKAKYFEKPIDIYPKTETEKKAEIEKERRKVIDYFNQIKQRWDNGTDRHINS